MTPRTPRMKATEEAGTCAPHANDLESTPTNLKITGAMAVGATKAIPGISRITMYQTAAASGWALGFCRVKGYKYHFRVQC